MTMEESQGASARESRFWMGWVAILLAVSNLYFFTGGGWNQAAHFDLVRAIVERGTVRIDGYQENTGDISLYDGHYYSCKPPGTAFLAVPFVLVCRGAQRLLGGDPAGDPALLWQGRLAALVCGLVPTVAAALCLLGIARDFGASPGAGLFGAISFGLGTPAWIYGTFFWSQALSTGCLLVAFLSVLRWRREGLPGRDYRLGLLTGGSVGWAVLTEYQSIGAGVLILFLGIWLVREGGRGRIFRLLGAVALGGSVPAALLAHYNTLAFGSVFRLGYGYVVNFQHVQGSGLFGVGVPQGEVLVSLLVGPFRGILLLAPVLFAAPWGIYRMIRDPERLAIGLAAAALVAYFLLFNASYKCWWGGWSFGPRFLAPGIGILSIGLVVTWEQASRELRVLLSVMGATSVLIMLIGISTNAMPAEEVKAPFAECWWPSFLEGRLSQNGGQSYGAAPVRSFNLGEAIGLRGLSSLIPLGLFWGALGSRGVWKGKVAGSGEPPTPALEPSNPEPLKRKRNGRKKR